MADETNPEFSDADWKAVAQFVSDETEKRKRSKDRREKEAVWKEVDRQIAMIPLKRKVESGKRADWLPEFELPLQFNTLEVNQADARRLKFPRGSEWFSVSAELSDEYAKRFKDRRFPKGDFDIIEQAARQFGGQIPREALEGLKGQPLTGDIPMPTQLDQDTANALVKVTLDHFHRLYDFRAAIDLFDAECLKYGTGLVRVREVATIKNALKLNEADIRGPAVIPCSIKNTYLDDSPIATFQEGISIAPWQVRSTHQLLDDLLVATVKGGPERGWMPARLAKMKSAKTGGKLKGYIEVLEAEGDLVVSTSGSSLILQDVLVTVAVGAGGPEVIRFRADQQASYVTNHYMRPDIESPYGVSPLMKGQPLQEAATEALNAAMAVAALQARPPVAYDRNDPEMLAQGGPNIHPGAQWPTDAPNAIEVHKIGDLNALIAVYLALIKQYEDTTQVNDPRRGSSGKSHTTAFQADLEATRGLGRIDDYVMGQEAGPMTKILNMEFAIAKRTMKKPQSIFVGAGGIEGWVKLAAGDLADNAVFMVHGSAGVLSDRQRAESFASASNFAIQVATVAAQLGKPVDLNFEAMILEGYHRAAIQNAAKFIGPSGGFSGGTPAQPAVPGTAPGLSAGGTAPVFPNGQPR